MVSFRVAVVSTGSMGTAIAKALLSRGDDVTVWNRDPAKAMPLGALGAHVSPSLDEAVDRADVLICVPDPYSAVREYLTTDAVADKLAAKVVVVMSSCGSPDEPEWLQRQLAEVDATHIDGKMFGYAGDIGRPDTPLAYCGDTTTFEAVRPLLTGIGNPIYLGEQITAAYIFEAALISWFVATCGGAINGLALCRAAELPLETFVDTCIAAVPGIHRYLAKVATQMMPSENYDPVMHETASLGGVLTVLNGFARTFRRYGIEPALLETVAPAMRRKVESGEGEKDIAAIADLFVRP